VGVECHKSEFGPLLLAHSYSLLPLHLLPCDAASMKALARHWCHFLGLPRIQNCEQKYITVHYKLPSLSVGTAEKELRQSYSKVH
jgi:hypothetical protein